MIECYLYWGDASFLFIIIQYSMLLYLWLWQFVWQIIVVHALLAFFLSQSFDITQMDTEEDWRKNYAAGRWKNTQQKQNWLCNRLIQ